MTRYSRRYGPLAGAAGGLLVGLLYAGLCLSELSRLRAARGAAHTLLLVLLADVLPFVLAGGLSGYLIERVVIGRLMASLPYLARHRLGAVAGAVLGVVCPFPLLFSSAFFGCGLAAAFLWDLGLGEEAAWGYGCPVGTALALPPLVLAASLAGLMAGALAEGLLRALWRLLSPRRPA